MQYNSSTMEYLLSDFSRVTVVQALIAKTCCPTSGLARTTHASKIELRLAPCTDSFQCPFHWCTWIGNLRSVNTRLPVGTPKLRSQLWRRGSAPLENLTESDTRFWCFPEWPALCAWKLYSEGESTKPRTKDVLKTTQWTTQVSLIHFGH